MDKNPVSYHIFAFPFKWDYKEKASAKLKDLSFGQRINRDQFKSKLNNNWDEDNFIINSEVDYNQYKYFYEYARPAIYDKDKGDEDEVYPVYQYKYDSSGQFIIKIKNGPEYELEIDQILLKVYETGVAILSFHLANYNQEHSKSDILKINDFGRRVYPQFLGEGDSQKNYVDAPKNKFLADKLSLQFDDGSKIEEEFQHFNKLEKINNNPDKTAKIISQLLGEDFIDGKRSNVQKEDIYINPIVDDRMFVISWYGNQQLMEKLQKFRGKEENYNYLKSDYWYKYSFVDGNSKTCQNKLMTQRLVKDSTYERWIEEGSLYGVTPYSLVLLTDRSWFAENILLTHLQTMYYQMAILSLAQRASVLRFSEEVSYISRLNETHLIDRVRELHENYIQFVNRMYFKEVTAQEQGIEMYDLMQDKMRIASDIKDLDTEINELHQYATLIEEKKTAKTLNLLTIIGALFVIPSFVTGFFGMNIGEFVGGEQGIFANNNVWELCIKFFEFKAVQQWFALYFSAPIVALVIVYFIYKFRDIIPFEFLKKKMFWLFIFFILLVIQIVYAVNF